MSSAKNFLKSLLGETVETIAEDIVEEAVSDLDKKIDELISEEAAKLLGKIESTDKLPAELKAALSMIGAGAVEELIKPALLNGVNDVIEYVWEKVQDINKKDSTSAAPKVGSG